VSSSTFGNIHVWEGCAANCTIDDQDNTITINEPGTYGFRAFDPNDPNDYVTVTGDITMGSHYDGDITIHGYLNGDLNAGRPKDVFIDGPGTHNGNISILNGQLYMDTLRIGDEACKDDPNDPNDAYDPNVPYATMNGDIYIRYGTQGHGGGAGALLMIYGNMYGRVAGWPILRGAKGGGAILSRKRSGVTTRRTVRPATLLPGFVAVAV